MNYTLTSLCTGIGVFDLAFTLAGFDVRNQVEVDPFCRSVLAARHEQFFPNATILEDVYNARKHNLNPTDALCAGFPCQPVSSAGQRRGVDDERWLWDEIARVIGETRPRVVFLENVRGLYTANDGNAFKRVVGDLAALGYDAEWALITASASVGAPHQRARWFCIATDANADGKRLARRRIQARAQESRFKRFSENRAAYGVKPGLDGILSDGLAVRMEQPDGYPYWAAPLAQTQHEYEPPRTVSASTLHRKERVKAIGNAAVLPLAYLLAKVCYDKLQVLDGTL